MTLVTKVQLYGTPASAATSSRRSAYPRDLRRRIPNLSVCTLLNDIIQQAGLVSPFNGANSRGGWSIDRPLDGPIKVNVTNRLLDHDSAWSQGGYH